MAAFNVVRFRVKPGREREFVDGHRDLSVALSGMQHANLIDTGNHTYCFVGEWQDMDSLAAARPEMISILDRFRDTLEDLGSGLGVTDPVSGSVVVHLR